VAYAAALEANLRRLKLQVTTIAPFHGTRIVDAAEITMQAAKTSLSAR
jgi:hypothetical protein